MMKLNGKRKRHRQEARQIQTGNGIVEGKQLRCSKGPIDVFLGIPYAKPPTGELRFKKPEAISPWIGIMKCKRYQSRAPQNDFFWDRIDLRVGKNEDCLYLNIIAPGWKPRPEFRNGFPVMFYIHGGGYLVDSAVKYHYSKIARLLVSKDVIVVTIQYRLGFLGFFTTGDDICPGNFGIWDQVMALKWVKKNIEYFGGDAERITLIGQSAGAASADLLALSPYSRDLFEQVILLGGNAECPWAVSDSKKVIDYCHQRAQKLGWQGTDNAEMIKFLRRLPASKLAGNLIGNKALFATGRLPLTPVVDGDLIPCPIVELRKQAPTKPSLIGLTEDEGLLFAAIGRLPCNMKDIELGIQLIADNAKENGIDAEQVIGQIYLNRKHDSTNSRENIRRAFIDMLSDLTSNYGTRLYVDKLVERGEIVYMFSLEHCNPACYGLLNLYLPYRTKSMYCISAATHGVDLIYLLDANIFVSPFVKTAVDKQITRFLTQSVVNFIKYRNPNIASEKNTKVDQEHFLWKPVTLDAREQHLRIAHIIEMRDEFKNGRMKLLKDIFGDLILK
uniref:Carboxylic ester hydrolase n=1 Tax=Setaria digitata TaxID=48799 RepID=A0A915PTH5_9BILA